MSVAVIEKKGNVLHVRPEIRLNTASTQLLERELQPYLDDSFQQIVMDFSRVDYITSSTLRLLLQLEQMMEELSGDILVVHVGKTVLNIMELSGFIEVVRVVPEENA